MTLAGIWHRPRAGRAHPDARWLESRTGPRGHVRAAVEAVRRSFGDHEPVGAAWSDMLASRWREEPLATSGTPSLQASWGLVAMRVVGRSIGVLSANASLRDAETWFLAHPEPVRERDPRDRRRRVRWPAGEATWTYD